MIRPGISATSARPAGCRCWSMRARTSAPSSMRSTRRFRPFAELERLDAAGVHELCPLLRDDARHGIADLDGIRLDPHALLQGNLRQLRARGGELHTGARDRAIERDGGAWTRHHRKRRALLRADAGQRGGRLGRSKSRRSPGVGRSGLEPKRRTIITFDAPPGTGARWPAVRQDGRRRALFRAGERPAVRLADGRGAERAVRRPAGRI